MIIAELKIADTGNEHSTLHLTSPDLDEEIRWRMAAHGNRHLSLVMRRVVRHCLANGVEELMYDPRGTGAGVRGYLLDDESNIRPVPLP